MPADVMLAMSAPVGATRLQGELATGDPLSESDRSAIKTRTVDALVPVAFCAGRLSGSDGSNGGERGTARALARLAMARTRGKASGRASEVNQVELPTGQGWGTRLPARRSRPPERLALPGHAVAPSPDAAHRGGHSRDLRP